MTDFVCSFEKTQIGKYNYTFYFVTLNEAVPSEKDMQALSKPVRIELGLEVGRTMQDKGVFIQALGDDEYDVAREVVSKNWPEQIHERMRTKYEPYVLVINENFEDFDPMQDSWLLIWATDFDWNAFFRVLRWLARMTRKGEDLFDYFSIAVSKQQYGHFAQKYARGIAIDAMGILSKESPFIQNDSKKSEAIKGVERTPKVFISYNHSDSDVAMKLKKALKDNGIEITIDTDSVKAGEDINKFIQHAIANTHITLSIVSNKSLLSGWVAIETVDTFYCTKYKNDKKFIACYINNDFFNRGFTLKAVEKIDEEIREIESLMEKYAEHKIDTSDLNAEKTRYYDLRNNLSKIIGKLKESVCIDISGDHFEENLPRIVKSIKTSA